MIDSLRTNVHELIEQRISAQGTNRELLLLLHREHAAARMLGKLGGLPLLPLNTGRLVCGPLRIAELGLHRQLGEFVAELPDTNGELGSMLRLFSQVGLAHVQFDAGRLGDAAELALDLRCPSCRRHGRRVTSDQPLLCLPSCLEFDRYNPSFAALKNKYEKLSEYGTDFAIAALLGMATTEITKADMDLAKATRYWERAVDCAERFAEEQLVLQEVVDTALGRAEALSRKKDWTGAITVLDAALDVVGTRQTQDQTEWERVATQLADLLTTRAVITVNDDRSKASVAHQDLSRAVELAPHNARATESHGQVLLIMARDRIEAGDVMEGVRLLMETLQECERGLLDKPGNGDLIELQDITRHELNMIATMLTRRPDSGRW
jgi:hypothetical protein